MLVFRQIVSRCDNYVLLIVISLVIDRSDYDQEHERSFGCGFSLGANYLD
jgi:hypothetical protein